MTPRAHRLLLCLPLLLVSACRTAAPRPAVSEPPPTPTRVAAVDELPDWLVEPLSWDKLAAVEAWLALEGSSPAHPWHMQGQLVLNQGRIELSRQEVVRDEAANKLAQQGAQKGAQPGAPKAPSKDVLTRVRTAKAALERVAASEASSDVQQELAKRSIKVADGMLKRFAPSKLAALQLVARAAWGAMPARPDKMDRTKAPYLKVTVHHSADADPVRLDGTLATTKLAVQQIQKAHMNGSNTHYGDIGYHFVIDPYGRILEGRDLQFQGAHAYGDNNIQNIGVCLIGNFDEEKPTKAALDSLRRTIDHLRGTYKIPRASVFNHREMRHTECPGDALAAWVERYRRM